MRQETTINKQCIRYYSFWIGEENRPENWVLFDLKCPAIDVRTAICSWFFLVKISYSTKRSGFYGHSDSWISPSIEMVRYHVRKVIEYEKIYTPKKGYTIHQYKRTGVYNPQDYTCLFWSSKRKK